MSLRRFLYYILKEDGRSGKVVNKVVTYSGQPSPLPQTPSGWQQLLLQWERSKLKHSLDSEVSLPLGFVRDGARIGRDAMYKETIETKRQLLIQRLFLEITPTTFNWVYKYFYRGPLNFAEAEDGQDMLKIPIGEAELKKLLKAGEKTYFNIAMNDPRCVSVILDGIRKSYTKNYAVQEDTEVTGTANYYLGMLQADGEGESANIAFFDVPFQTSSAYPNTDYFAEAIGFQNVRVKGEIAILFNKDSPFELRVETNDGGTGGFPQYSLVNIAGSPRPAGTLETFTFDQTFSIPAADRINMKIYGGDPLDPTPQFTVQGGNVKIIYDFTPAATYCKAWKRFDLYQELIYRITGNKDFAISQLCTDYNSLLITCADAIRGIETAELKTSLADFFADTDSILMAGMAVLPDGSGIELEEREKYYSEAEVTDLGNVTEFVKKPAEDLMANTFKAGNQKQDIEDINGKYDPNGNNQFTGPLTVPDPHEYSMVSPYKAGPYEIESIRRNLEGKTTTDDNRDNDVYVIAAVETPAIVTDTVQFLPDPTNIILMSPATVIMPGMQIRITGSVSNDQVLNVLGFTDYLLLRWVRVDKPLVAEGPVLVTIEYLTGLGYTLNRPAYDVLEGVPNDTIFNLPFLTPKTKLLRHGRWIASMNAGLGTKKIAFSSGKDNKNTELKTELAGVVIDEDRDETIGNLGSPLWLPWYFIFKTEVPVSLPELLEENPNRCFKFTDEYGQQWTGFLIMAGIAPNEYTPQEFRLLAAPSNDITKLIHG